MGGAEVRLVLTPHMDDEVIGMGGTIALLSKAGYDVVVAYLTDGAGAYEGHVLEGEERDRYSGIRKEEARRALGVLGVRRPPVFLDFPDSRLDEFVPQAVDKVVELILKTGAKVIYAPHPDEYHPDHRAANKIARLAAWKAIYLRGRWIEHLYEYEVWPPMRSFTDVVNITDYAELKREALEVYAKGSQRYLSPDALLALNKYRAFWTDIHGFAEVFNDVNYWVLRKEPPV
ncbi:MAG: PIG-L family deacetylase, partial [Thermoproteus sp.]|nr:PIG-L family deacetylase [Thermoproteus sp.]